MSEELLDWSTGRISGDSDAGLTVWIVCGEVWMLYWVEEDIFLGVSRDPNSSLENVTGVVHLRGSGLVL